MKIIPWLVCAFLAVLAYFLKFHALGYGFSALVCCGIIAIILFYQVSRILLPRFPVWMPRLRQVFTVCLVLGLLVFAVTEAVIIKASFGSPKEQAEYMVVLGAKVRVTGPSASLWDRIHGAYGYLQEHPQVIAIVSGGQGDDEPMTEAQSMYDELVALGIDPDRIWMEPNATSTWENINFALDLVEAKTGTRPQKLGVVSSEYHLFRASLFAKACNVDFVGIPAHTSRFSQMVNHFLREVAGVWHYLILGGQYD